MGDHHSTQKIASHSERKEDLDIADYLLQFKPENFTRKRPEVDVQNEVMDNNSELYEIDPVLITIEERIL